ncbi:hypothetical protein JTE90_002859 [Oedothorax gibbosus]|uniref:UMP-CMP kinase n=1 Tax=Oedothorax gibbosus TaxID=931172 RepID=A0AAV6TUQ2_9ARAC|nr:hypothetical protein JTE90_002859 [Oedothorax gibbosus]
MASTPKVVFVLGAPGAGKGTQCKKIVDNFGFIHLSAGDLLRAERNTPGSQYGELIENHIRNGTIVPVEITCRLINEAMKSADSEKFLIDGFPRNKDNLDGWNKEMTGKADVQFILFIDCSEEACIERCLQRGAAGSGRSDDNSESLKKRFRTFHGDTLPIVNQFGENGMVVKVDGSQDPDTVFKTIEDVFKKHF